MERRPHKQIIVNATIGYAPTDEQEMRDFIVKMITDIEMKVASLTGGQSNPIAWYCNDEFNEGMTAAGILTTSHVVFHVWDKWATPAIRFDLYSCSDFSIDQILTLLDDKFKIKKADGMFFDREQIRNIHHFEWHGPTQE